MKTSLYFTLIILVGLTSGCYNYSKETIKITELHIEPEKFITNYVEVDDFIYLPVLNFDGELETKKVRTGSHIEPRIKFIPETYFLTFHCQHGIQTAEIYTDKHPTLKTGIKKNFPYIIRFGTNRFRITHKYVFEDLNKRETLEGK